MMLYDVLAGVDYTAAQGSNVEIKDITIDSRRVREGSLFVCIKGLNVDSHSFIPCAVKSGAAAVVCESVPESGAAGASVIRVSDTRRELGVMASNFYGNPSRGLCMFGVTGTKGKTSTTYFLEDVLRRGGIKSGIIGTTGALLDGREIGIKYMTSTTPDAIELHRILREMADGGADGCVMEVSSHALAFDKVNGIQYDTCIFTNLTHEHLDFHETLEKYAEAKAKLFTICKTGVFNADDGWFKKMTEHATCRIVTFGVENEADYRAEHIELSPSGVRFSVNIKGKDFLFHAPVPGRFTVYNVLGVIAATVESGLPPELVVEAVGGLKGVRGRIETVTNDKGFTVIVDYAHTPDSLDKIIRSIRDFTAGKIITVFGCGGNKDTAKRPVMGAIAGRLSDYCVITSDNPRNENPEDILRDIEPGVLESGCPYEKESDRRVAIGRAIRLARPGDSVIIAGKGHEDYQEFENKRRIHFDDAETARAFLSVSPEERNEGTLI